MPGLRALPEGPVILAGYAVGLAWFLTTLRQPGPASLDAGARALIAFLLPTAGGLVSWAFQAIETRRPVYTQRPGDSRAAGIALLHIEVFIVALHALVLWQLTRPHDQQAGALQAVFVLVGGLLISVGNVLPTTRPNTFVGVRTRRTVHSRALWIAVNRVAGVASLALGLAFIASAVVLPTHLIVPASAAATLATAAFVIVRYRQLTHAAPLCEDEYP